jgi:Ca2+-binding RTX toxin-like protein
LVGTSGSDCILGKGAQDTISGQGGNDFISGGDGNDIITGGVGNDFIQGGTGQDDLRGQDGDDAISGGDGDDYCSGDNGNDLMHGGQGQDGLYGVAGHDDLFGDIGDDMLDGGIGNDHLTGSGLHDQCTGGTGTNTYFACQNQPNTPGPLTVAFQVTGNWTSDYCVTMNVTNPTAQTAIDWSVLFDLQGANIYNSWNGLFNAVTGTVTVVPNVAWNQELSPGEVDATMGFCAHRTIPGSPPPTSGTTEATMF